MSKNIKLQGKKSIKSKKALSPFEIAAKELAEFNSTNRKKLSKQIETEEETKENPFSTTK